MCAAPSSWSRACLAGPTIGATASTNSVRWRAGATSNWRCCRGIGAATPALTRPRHSIPTRSCRSGAILTRAALTIWRRALLFSRPRSAALGRSAAGPGQRLWPLRRGLFRGGTGRGARPRRLLSLHLSRRRSCTHRGAGAGASRKGFAVTSVFVTSLKDEAALSPLRAFLAGRILRRRSQRHRLFRAYGSGRGNGARRARRAGAAGRAGWRWSRRLARSQRGLGPSDLAMHVALPEIDGRILSRAISFKAASARDARTEFAAVAHQPLADRVDFSAELARRWASLRRKPRRTSASLACCRIIRRAADAPAMRSASIRPRAPSLFARPYAPRAMM